MRELDEELCFVFTEEVDSDPFVLLEVDGGCFEAVGGFIFLDCCFFGLRCLCLENSLLFRYVIEGLAGGGEIFVVVHDNGAVEIELVRVAMLLEDGDEEAVDIEEGDVSDEAVVEALDRCSFVDGDEVFEGGERRFLEVCS
jgi:hypothetical protein